MLGHTSFGVTDLERSTRFYDAALAPLGVVRVWSFPDAAGYGVAGGPDKLALKVRADAVAPGPGFHLAFEAPDPAAVQAFHSAGVANGGRCNGPPGPRPRYGPAYHAAFVIDPDGYALEAKALALGTAREALEAQVACWNRGDLEGYLALHHEDVVYQNAEVTLMGIDALRAHFNGRVQGQLEVAVMQEQQGPQVTVVAVEASLGSWSGQALLTWQLVAGRWLLAVDATR